MSSQSPPTVSISDLETNISSLDGGRFSEGQAQTEEEYKLRHRKEDREDRILDHNLKMEIASLVFLLVVFTTGGVIMIFAPNDQKSFGAGLMGTPVGAAANRLLGPGRREANGDEKT